jgi:hypothetical protein
MKKERWAVVPHYAEHRQRWRDGHAAYTFANV